VIDEPFYAYYLERTAKNHPMAAEVIASGETNWQTVAEQLTKGPIPGDKRIFFQKQMTHHLLPEMGRDWIGGLTNCFLIRDPREVILSYIKKNPEPALEDLGFVQQCQIFDFVRNRSELMSPVIDADDVLKNPDRMLGLLCDAIGVPFDKGMLSWPPGLRDTDGVWAKHWYDAVAKSTSFGPYAPRDGTIPDSLSDIYQKCRECYQRLSPHKLK